MNPIVFATIPAILALVNLGKRLGLKSPLSLLLAVILGVVLSVLDVLLGTNIYYQAAMSGLLLGLAAAGLYDVAQIVRQPNSTESVDEESIPAADDGSVSAEYMGGGRGLSAAAAKMLGK
jgi:membrane associated rhomboid family serine protease